MSTSVDGLSRGCAGLGTIGRAGNKQSAMSFIPRLDVTVTIPETHLDQSKICLGAVYAVWCDHAKLAAGGQAGIVAAAGMHSEQVPVQCKVHLYVGCI